MRGPRDLHPIFFGSFDWHSCVHGYWTAGDACCAATRTSPRRPPSAPCSTHAFTAANVAGELAYLQRPSARGFERPYGWAWLLKLQAELLAHDAPLGRDACSRWPTPSPRRFATSCRGPTIRSAPASIPPPPSPWRWRSDYARGRRRRAPSPTCSAPRPAPGTWPTATRQAWEPSGDDFLSPTLMEAECLRRLLPARRVRRLVRRLPAARRAQASPRACSRRPWSPTAATARSPTSTASTSRAPGAGASSRASLPDPVDRRGRRRPAPGRQPAARRRRLHGRALAGLVRPAGADRRRALGSGHGYRNRTSDRPQGRRHRLGDLQQPGPPQRHLGRHVGGDPAADGRLRRRSGSAGDRAARGGRDLHRRRRHLPVRGPAHRRRRVQALRRPHRRRLRRAQRGARSRPSP